MQNYKVSGPIMQFVRIWRLLFSAYWQEKTYTCSRIFTDSIHQAKKQLKQTNKHNFSFRFRCKLRNIFPIVIVCPNPVIAVFGILARENIHVLKDFHGSQVEKAKKQKGRRTEVINLFRRVYILETENPTQLYSPFSFPGL